jgi:hypothetical protein
MDRPLGAVATAESIGSRGDLPAGGVIRSDQQFGDA